MQAILGSQIRVRRDRGNFFQSLWSDKVLVTIHPSILLRLPNKIDKEKEYQQFVKELSLLRL